MSQTQNGTRKRSENWTREERDIFLQIVKNYREVLDNLSTNAQANKLKNICWNHITNKFQDLTHSKRDKSQLKTFWKRLKLAARKKAKLGCDCGSINDVIKCDDLNYHDTINLESSNYAVSGTHMYDKISSDIKESSVLKVKSPTRSEVVLLPDNNKNNYNLNTEMDDDGDPHTWPSPLKFETEVDDIMVNGESTHRNNTNNKDHKLRNDRKRDLDYQEYLLKKNYLRRYHKNELEHQKKRHQLEIVNLFIERKRLKLELEISKKKMHLLINSP